MSCLTSDKQAARLVSDRLATKRPADAGRECVLVSSFERAERAERALYAAVLVHPVSSKWTDEQIDHAIWLTTHLVAVLAFRKAMSGGL